MTVNAQDDAPVVINPISDVEAEEDAENLIVDLTPVFSDIDNDDAEITKEVVSNSNSDMVVASIAGNNLTLDFQSDQSGDATVVVRGNSAGQGVNDTLIVSVGGVNDPPVLSMPEQIAFNEDDSVMYAMSQIYEWVDDPDDADSTYCFPLLTENM